MDDTIRRQTAIDSIMEEPSEARYPVFYAEKLKQLPSAQSEPRWIPVKKDLPKKDGAYLVTYLLKFPDKEYESVEEADYINGKFEEDLYATVTAWMPLPKPYERSEDV